MTGYFSTFIYEDGDILIFIVMILQDLIDETNRRIDFLTTELHQAICTREVQKAALILKKGGIPIVSKTVLKKAKRLLGDIYGRHSKKSSIPPEAHVTH